MLKNNILDKSYPRYALILFFNWLMFTNMPFLGSYKYYLIAIQIISIVPYLFSKNDLSKTFKMNITCCLFLAVVLISSIFTKSFFNKNLWMTILTLFTAFEFISKADRTEIKKLSFNLFISLEILLAVSFVGIMLIKFTDLENSSNFTISYSLGNFIQFGRFFGVFNNCNLLGPLAAIATFLSLFQIKKNKDNVIHLILDIALLSMNFYLLIGSGSITSLFAFLCSIIVMSLCHLKKHRKIVFFTILIIGILSVTTVLMNMDLLSEIFHRDLSTASDRTIIWNSCFEILKNHPLVGYGNPANYVEVANAKNLYIHENGTHSMYVEIATLYGYPAFILFLISMLMTVLKTLKCYLMEYNIKDETILFPFMCIIFGLCQGLGEGQLLFTNSPIMIVFLTSLVITNYNLHELGKQADKA